MDKRILGVFMLLATQQDWIHDLLPKDDATTPQPPDYTTTNLYSAGVNEYIQDTVFRALSQQQPPQTDPLLMKQLANAAASDMKWQVYRRLFEILSESVAPILGYTQPPCPNIQTLQYIINAVNNAPVPPQDNQAKVQKEAEA